MIPYPHISHDPDSSPLKKQNPIKALSEAAHNLDG